ncbi:unnamed protein product [Peniophora sp. CBMAI 1063]|nr:unnamed protein product [Peniophora sp. CBMAI 1063]
MEKKGAERFCGSCSALLSTKCDKGSWTVAGSPHTQAQADGLAIPRVYALSDPGPILQLQETHAEMLERE